MIDTLLTFLTIFISSVPYIAFFYQVYSPRIPFHNALLATAASTPALYAIVTCSAAIPAPAGMFIKTILSMSFFIFLGRFCIRASLPQLVFAALLSMSILAVLFIPLAALINVFPYVNANGALFGVGPLLFNSLVTILQLLVQAALAPVFRGFLSRLSRWYIPLACFLAAHIAAGPMIVYYSVNMPSVSGWQILLISLVILLSAVFPLYLYSVHNHLTRLFSRMEHPFVSAEDTAGLLDYLNRETELFRNLEAEIRTFRKNGCLTADSAPLVSRLNDHPTGWYSDSPAFSTLLLYYEQEFERHNILYKISVHCPIDSTMPEELILLLFNGLLSCVSQFVRLAIIKKDDRRFITFESGPERRRELQLMLESTRELMKAYDLNFSVSEKKQAAITAALSYSLRPHSLPPAD